MSDLTQETIDRVAIVERRLKEAGIKNMSFTKDPERWNKMTSDQRANAICDVLEAMLDGKCSEALKFNDSRRICDCVTCSPDKSTEKQP